MLAAEEGRTDVVEELIGWGANVNAKDKVRCLRGYCRQWSRREKCRGGGNVFQCSRGGEILG